MYSNVLDDAGSPYATPALPYESIIVLEQFHPIGRSQKRSRLIGYCARFWALAVRLARRHRQPVMPGWLPERTPRFDGRIAAASNGHLRALAFAARWLRSRRPGLTLGAGQTGDMTLASGRSLSRPSAVPISRSRSKRRQTHAGALTRRTRPKTSSKAYRSSTSTSAIVARRPRSARLVTPCSLIPQGTMPP